MDAGSVGLLVALVLAFAIMTRGTRRRRRRRYMAIRVRGRRSGVRLPALRVDALGEGVPGASALYVRSRSRNGRDHKIGPPPSET